MNVEQRRRIATVAVGLLSCAAILVVLFSADKTRRVEVGSPLNHKTSVPSNPPPLGNSDVHRLPLSGSGTDQSTALHVAILRVGNMSPVEGVTVAMDPLDATATSEMSSSTTGPDGTCVLVVPKSHLLHRLHVEASLDTGSITQLVPIPESDNAGDPIVLFVPPAASMTGFVTDIQGKPVANVEVLVYRAATASLHELLASTPIQRQTSNVEGRYELRGLIPPFTIWARSEQRALPALIVGGPDLVAMRHEFNLSLAETACLSGLVRDSQGRSIAGTRISALAQSIEAVNRSTGLRGLSYQSVGKRGTSTNEEGRFELDNFPRGPAQITAQRLGFLVRTQDQVVGDSELLIELEGQASLRGEVIGHTGLPLPGAKVRYIGIERQHSATSDNDGLFLMDASRLDTHGLLATAAPGHATSLMAIDVESVGQAMVQIHLEPGQRIAGQVVSESGNPLKGILVKLTGGRSVFRQGKLPLPLHSLFGNSSVFTDDHGQFAFEGLNVDDFMLEIGSSAAGPGGRWKVRSGFEDLILQLGESPMPYLSLQGTVRTDSESQAVSGATIVLRKIIDGVPYRTAQSISSTDGRFLVEDLVAGTYWVEVTHERFATTTTQLQLESHSLRDLEFYLANVCRLDLQVLNADHSPAADFMVWAIQDDGIPILIETADNRRSSPTLTDRNGKAALHGLPQREVLLEVQPFEGVAKTRFKLNLLGLESSEYEMILPYTCQTPRRTLDLVVYFARDEASEVLEDLSFEIIAENFAGEVVGLITTQELEVFESREGKYWKCTVSLPLGWCRLVGRTSRRQLGDTIVSAAEDDDSLTLTEQVVLVLGG